MENYISNGPGGVAFVGPEAVNLFGAIALKTALVGYAKFKMQPNRHYTPTRMLDAAGRIVGRKYKRGEYMRAADDLAAWIETARASIETRTERA